MYYSAVDVYSSIFEVRSLNLVFHGIESSFLFTPNLANYIWLARHFTKTIDICFFININGIAWMGFYGAFYGPAVLKVKATFSLIPIFYRVK